MIEKTALITGASNGMGKAISLSLAGEGYNLIICARNEKNLLNFQKEILEIYPQISVIAIPADLSKKVETLALAERVLEEWGGIEVLINNVGQYETGTLVGGEDELMEQMMNINFYSAYYLSKLLGKGMAERRKGHIINIVSIAGKEPVLGAGSYSISKFALQGLCKNLRLELKPFNVCVTAILPGSTLTGSWEGQKVDPNTLISPQDIALMVLSSLRLSPGANLEEIEIRPIHP